jgi:hypothetical protein
LDVLRWPQVGPDGSALAGVGFGSKTSDFPFARVVEVSLAPIVKQESHSRDHGHTYRDAAGRELSLAEVIADAVAHGGVLHFGEKISFRIKDGVVAGFAIYGAHLDAFQYINRKTNWSRNSASLTRLSPMRRTEISWATSTSGAPRRSSLPGTIGRRRFTSSISA